METSALELVVIGSVGVLAGVVNGTIGGGSLLTYPVLVWAGIPPVYAAATNTTGLAAGNPAALIPHRKGDLVDFSQWRLHAAVMALGGFIGGVLLIALPERIFEFLVPILLVVSSVMMLRKPMKVSDSPTPRNRTLLRLLGGGTYNGYFGPGQGVIAMSILARDGRLTMHQIVVIKNFMLAASNVVVAVLFIATGHVIWSAALILLVLVACGGWIGGRISHRVNPTVLRLGVAAVGFISAGVFIVQ